MQRGEVVAIYVAPRKQHPMHAVSEARAVPGAGLEGDRYFRKQGTFWKPNSPSREVTLIEQEAVEAMNRESPPFTAADSRRNLVIRGVRLNDLLGEEFMIGEVRLRGIKLCHPCSHLARLTGGKPVLQGLKMRGGLRAQILNEGTVRVGDAVESLGVCVPEAIEAD